MIKAFLSQRRLKYLNMIEVDNEGCVDYKITDGTRFHY